MAVGLGHYLTVAAILFTLGVFGIFLNRKNVIIIMMSIELMLLAVNINFVAFSVVLQDLAGQVFAMFCGRVSRRLRWVSTIAPIIATSRISPAIWK